MEIKFIGVGAAFETENFQNNHLISKNGKHMLLDAGTDLKWMLKDNKLKPIDIDAVYVSHAHADHIGGLEFLAFKTQWSSHRIKLFIHESWVDDIWNESLKGGLKGIEGKKMHLEDYFTVIKIKDNEVFEWEGISFNTVQTNHIFAQYSAIDSFGLMLNDVGGDRIYVTTDCQFSPETAQKAFYREAKYIFHDCEVGFKSGVHSNYEDLKGLPAEFKSKMWLTHYQDVVTENWDEWQAKAIADGFLGFVKQGAIFSERYGLQCN